MQAMKNLHRFSNLNAIIVAAWLLSKTNALFVCDLGVHSQRYRVDQAGMCTVSYY